MIKPTAKYASVLVTAPDLKTARKLAEAALKARLIACANLVAGVESHYRWQGKIEKSAEVMLMMKTSRSKVRALENLIVAKHPYDTPEFLVVPIEGGNSRYLAWMAGCLKKE